MYPYDRQFSVQFPGSQPFSTQGSTSFPQQPFGPLEYGTGFNGFPGQGFNPGGFNPGVGQFPGQGGFNQGVGQGPPQGPPPSEIPPAQSQFETFAVDPGGIRGCLYSFTYIRLNNGRSFWFYPTFVGRNSVAGYRWRRRQYRWEYFGIDLEQIRSFRCR
ncbi:hypothetical protein [Metabacillus litoralis]|uniref:hypothetical protein n=1 Tax=Metabacillus litoralis TaxID=152268 RepID=UPI001CFDA200|nr:hypothetical protein [Metabacillus litoralis]